MPSIPFYCHTERWKPFNRQRTKERVAYLAERRNSAISKALGLYPETEHIFMVDSYYLRQVDQLASLLNEYDECDGILGASTWQLDKTRIRSKVRFFDSWTTPEAANLNLDNPGQTSSQVYSKQRWLRVRAVGACYVYPRQVWEQVGYGIPEEDGCEHNFFCERSGLPVWLSLSVKLWREPVVYSWPKRVRCSLNLGRFFLV